MQDTTSGEDGWQGFYKLCEAAVAAGELNEVFDFFLTLEEKEDLKLRFLLIQALLEGKKTQREISRDLKISISKITRGSNALKIIKAPLRDFLKEQM